MKKELSNNKVIFNDEKQSIMIRGHFDDYICGALTAIMKLARSGTLQGARAIWSAVDDFPIADTKYEQGLITFDNDEDYEMTKSVIEAAFESLEDHGYGEMTLIKEMTGILGAEYGQRKKV